MTLRHGTLYVIVVFVKVFVYRRWSRGRLLWRCCQSSTQEMDITLLLTPLTRGVSRAGMLAVGTQYGHLATSGLFLRL